MRAPNLSCLQFLLPAANICSSCMHVRLELCGCSTALAIRVNACMHAFIIISILLDFLSVGMEILLQPALPGLHSCTNALGQSVGEVIACNKRPISAFVTGMIALVKPRPLRSKQSPAHVSLLHAHHAWETISAGRICETLCSFIRRKILTGHRQRCRITSVALLA